MTRATQLVLQRFHGYTWVGVGAFLMEICALWAFLYYVQLSYPVAVTIAFTITTILSYTLFRRYSFFGSKREHTAGLGYFILFACICLIVTLGATHVLIAYFSVAEITARILIGTLIAPINFLINGFYNFNIF